MITIDTLPTTFLRLFPPGTPFSAILACFLVPDTWRRYARGQGESQSPNEEGDEEDEKEEGHWNLESWINILPTQSDVGHDFPLFWPWHLKFASKQDVLGDDNAKDPSSSFSSSFSSSVFSILPPTITGIWNSNTSLARNCDDAQHVTPGQTQATKQNLLARQESHLVAAWEAIRDNSGITTGGDHRDHNNNTNGDGDGSPLTYETFMHYWMIVATRVMYYAGLEDGEEGREAPASSVYPGHNLALVPFADFFNHSSDAVGFLAVDILKTCWLYPRERNSSDFFFFFCFVCV